MVLLLDVLVSCAAAIVAFLALAFTMLLPDTGPRVVTLLIIVSLPIHFTALLARAVLYSNIILAILGSACYSSVVWSVYVVVFALWQKTSGGDLDDGLLDMLLGPCIYVCLQSLMSGGSICIISHRQSNGAVERGVCREMAICKHIDVFSKQRSTAILCCSTIAILCVTMCYFLVRYIKSI